jgi:hypothetical protein
MPVLGSARWAAGGAALAAAALLTAGCGGSAASPQPKPDPGRTSAPPSQSPGPDLHYPRQLDASPLTEHPCRDLTDSQVRHVIGAEPGDGKPEHHLGAGCSWHPASIDEPQRSIAIHREAGDGGLRFVYSIKDEFGYFQPTTVAGYPAVVASPGNTATASGECAINVGVNEHAYFFSDFISGATPPADLKPCAKARQGAKYVIHNLKGGSQ